MWCGHAASALNPVIEAVTDNKCLDILAQSAGQCKCFLILFFAAQTILYIKVQSAFRQFMTGSYYTAYIVKNQTDSNTYNNFQAECFFKAIDKVYTKEQNSCRNLIFPY